MSKILCLIILYLSGINSIPLVISTWDYLNATNQAWNTIRNGGNGLDALVAGCSLCESQQCRQTVGFGGSPDENGETTLDSLIMDGQTMNVGAVGALKNIKNAIGVAKFVLENTKHSLLVGKSATDFAIKMGFKEESLSTDYSQQMWSTWKQKNCQPNFWINVIPDSRSSCGPYNPISQNDINNRYSQNHYNDFNFGPENHDTIGMIVIDDNNHIYAGTSTNGAKYKIPGRVGDSPIAGSGAYANNEFGASAATGDGDIMMRFLPSLIAVEGLRNGLSPHLAGENALRRIAKYYPDFVGGIIVANKMGVYGAACHGIDEFPYTVSSPTNEAAIIFKVKCFT